MSDPLEHLKKEIARTQRLAERASGERRRTLSFRLKNLQRVAAELESLRAALKAPDR